MLKEKWGCLCRAVDKFGDTLDFMLSGHRDEAAATAFFKQAIDANGFRKKVVMDKSGSNYAGLENINILLLQDNFASGLVRLYAYEYFQQNLLFKQVQFFRVKIRQNTIRGNSFTASLLHAGYLIYFLTSIRLSLSLLIVFENQ